MLIMVVGVALIQQITGIEAIMYYSNQIIKAGGITDTNTAFLVSMIMAIWKTGIIVVAARSLDERGRRPLLMMSVAGVMVAEMVMAAGLYLEQGMLNIVGLFIFVAAFSLGLGPITWLFCAEIMPVEVRAKGMVVSVGLNRIMSFIISDTFLSMVNAFEDLDKDIGGTGTKNIGQAGVFFHFAVISAFSLVFVYFLVPETKGKTLEEMGEYFERLAAKYPAPQGDEDEDDGSPAHVVLEELEKP